jgi:hypothetical protein
MTIEPLKVYYPYGGHKFLLKWYEHDEGNNIILASSEQGIKEIVQRIVYKYPDMEVRDFCEIEIVAPSNHLSEIAAEYKTQGRIAEFHRAMIGYLHELIRNNVPLPSPFAICSNYESSEDFAEERDSDHETDTWAREEHYDCRNCKNKIQMGGMTPKQLYEQYAEQWYAKHPIRDYTNERWVVSQAEPAKDDEPLWSVVTSFGHHSDGLVLEEVNVEKALEESHKYICDNGALFFFRRLKDIDVVDIKSIITDFRRNSKARMIQKAAAFEAREAQAKQKRIDETLELFKPKE